MELGGDSENPTDKPNEGFFQGLWDSLKSWFDSVLKSIGDNITKVVTKITDLNNSVSKWFNDIWSSIKDGFNNTVEWFKNFPDMFSRLLDKLFNPNSVYLRSTTDFDDLILERLTFVQQFQNAIDNLSTVGQPLQLPKIKFGQWEININAQWFEPHVPKIRASMSTLFWVLCALGCWRTISSAFGVGVNTAPGILINTSEKVNDTEIPGQYRFKL